MLGTYAGAQCRDRRSAQAENNANARFCLKSRELRKQRNLTQDQLAKSMGVKQAFVSKYETGERRLDFLDLVGICDVLGISIVKFAERFEASRKAFK
jgi:transcriptional regulator with XRE-family HTH domain